MTTESEAANAEGTALPEEQTEGQTEGQVEGQAAEEGQEGNTAAEAAEETKEPEVPRGVKRRLDKLTRKVSDIERERDHYRELVERGQQTAAPVDETPKTLADFGYDESKFAEYVTSQAEARAARTVQQRIEQQRAQARQSQMSREFEARADAFAETVEDFEEVVTNPSLPITPAMADAIRSSEEGPAVAYYLGKNPKIAQALSDMSATDAAREIGRIEERLAGERKAASKKTVTKAPAPPGKLDGAGSGTTVKADSPESDTLSDAEWLRRRNAQLKARRN